MDRAVHSSNAVFLEKEAKTMHLKNVAVYSKQGGHRNKLMRAGKFFAESIALFRSVSPAMYIVPSVLNCFINVQIFESAT